MPVRIVRSILAVVASGTIISACAFAQNLVIGVVAVGMKPNQTFEFTVHNGITLYTIGNVPANLRVRVINASKEDLLRLPEDHDECVTLATNLIVTGLGYSGSIQLNPIDNEAFLPRGMGTNARATLTLVFEALNSPEPGVIRIKRKDLPLYLNHALEITLTGPSPSPLQIVDSPASFFGSAANSPNGDCFAVHLADNAPSDGSRDFTLVAYAKPEACGRPNVSQTASLHSAHEDSASRDVQTSVNR